MNRPLVLGAGPAGSMAAITLARAGTDPLLIDREEVVGDALCGGFLSWRTAEQLRGIGLDLARLDAHPVTRLALYAGDACAEADLPRPGYGLSRRALDSAMRQMAVEAGAELRIARARSVDGCTVMTEDGELIGEPLFLSTGKHDVRGARRVRSGDDPALGLRIRVPATPGLSALVEGRIELHLFRGGYAGIVQQEDGSANICMALRKSMLADASGDPHALLARLAQEHPQFGARMAFAPAGLPLDTIGSVPYGWIARDSVPGVYRLGDQAAVIPSLAGEGMAIALASGEAAAQAWLQGQDAGHYQRSFAARARRPVRAAQALWTLGERKAGGQAMVALTRLAPALAGLAMRFTRI